MVQKLVSYCSTKYFGERSIRQHIIDTLTERRMIKKGFDYTKAREKRETVKSSVKCVTNSEQSHSESTSRINSSNITISINIRITINISICINSSINIIININITINISNFISINLNSSISISINISLNINLRFINEEC
eukprot:Em0006g1322a